MFDLTVETLAKYLEYNSKTGAIKRKDINREYKKLSSNRTAAIMIEGVKYSASRLVWMLFYGELPKYAVYFRNGIKNDLRIDNLFLNKAEELTCEYLRSIIHYDENTGEFTRIKTVSVNAVEGMSVGNIDKHGYRKFDVAGKRYKAQNIAWMYMTGSFCKNGFVDHINHLRDDNRWVNLREVSHMENCKNQGLRANNTSGTTGVRWDAKNKKWYVDIKVNYNSIFLGRFTDKSDAIAARKEANLKYGFHQNHGM